MRELNIEQQPELIEKVISINRVTKVTKGGKKLHFSALVVVGDTKGRVGFALDRRRYNRHSGATAEHNHPWINKSNQPGRF